MAQEASAATAGGPSLGQSLARRHVTMISIGGIIGAGLFVGSSVAIAAVGPAIIVSYLLAGAVILCVMRMLAEMSSLHPEVGAFTEFARLGIGHWAGFTSGWLYWYFWVVVVAIEAIAGGTLLSEWLPLPVWQIGLALMVLMTGVNLLSTRSYGEFEFWFASLKVAAISLFIAAGVAFILRTGGSRLAAIENLRAGGFAPHGPISVFAGVTSVIFALCGAEIATIAAAESAESAQTIARLTMSVAVRVTLFFVGSIVVIVAIVPWLQVTPGVSPFATALDRMGVPGAALIMKLIILTAVLSCLNSAVYISSRVLFTLAAKGDAPQWLVAVNGRRVPARAIIAGSLFGFGGVIASFVSPQHVFVFLVNASGANMLIIYLLTTASEIRLRYAAQSGRSAPPPIAMWWFPWLSWVVVAAISAVMVAMALRAELAAQLYASLCALAVVLAAFWLVRWRRG